MEESISAPDIVYIEDSPYDAELTMLALKDSGFDKRIKWLKDGKEAEDYLFPVEAEQTVKSLPKLILLDLKLPKVSGLELLRRIRSDQLTKRLPVVVLTSSREDNDVVESYELGVNSYIVKPVDYEKFTQCVKELGYYWMTTNLPPK